MKKLYDNNTKPSFLSSSIMEDLKKDPAPNALSEEDQAELNKMYGKIKHNAQQTSEQPKRKLFTLGKGDRSVSIANSSLSPSRLTMISGRKFQETYIKQLEGLIYTKEESLNGDKLIPLLVLMQASDDGKHTVNVKTGLHKAVSTAIVTGLNTFFHENRAILESMFKMFSSVDNLPAAAPK